MDLSKITTGQLHAMHVTAARDCHIALARTDAAGEVMGDLMTGPVGAYEAARANYRILLAKAKELTEHSRVLYNEICRRAGIDGERAVHDAMHEARDA